MNAPRQPRQRQDHNPIRDYLEADPPPMTKGEFARRVGITQPYLSMLLADNPPWPGRDICLAIAVVSEGRIDPNALAGWRGGHHAE